MSIRNCKTIFAQRKSFARGILIRIQALLSHIIRMGDSPALSEDRIRTISSILNLCERATINMEREGIANSIKAIIIICMKFVDKEALFKSVLPSMYIDWDYIRAQGFLPGNSASSVSGGGGGGQQQHAKKNNLLGDSHTWLQLIQFLDFGDLKMPERILQSQYPPLYCMHSGMSFQQSRCLD